jgi:hypothetical protein
VPVSKSTSSLLLPELSSVYSRVCESIDTNDKKLLHHAKNDGLTVVEGQNINKTYNSRVNIKDKHNDEVLQEIFMKIRARRERLIQTANNRYRSSASLSTNDSASSPEVTKPNRRQRLHASKLRQVLFEIQQQQQQQQQCVRRSAKDFLSHLRRKRKKKVDLQVSSEGDVEILSPVANEETVHSVRQTIVEDKPYVSNQPRQVDLVRQTSLQKSRNSCSARTQEMAYTEMKSFPVKELDLDAQPYESFPRVQKITRPRSVVHDALMDKDEDNDDDDLKSQDLDHTYVPDDLKRVFITACGTNFKPSTYFPDPKSSSATVSKSTSSLLLPELSSVYSRVCESIDTNDKKLRHQLETKTIMKRCEDEVKCIPPKCIPPTVVITHGLESNVTHDEDGDDAKDAKDAKDVAVVAAATANKPCLIPTFFISSFYPNDRCDDNCGYVTNTSKSHNQDHISLNGIKLLPHGSPKSSNDLGLNHETYPLKIGILAESDRSYEIFLYNQNISKVDSQEQLKRQDTQKQTHILDNIPLEDSFQSKTKIESTTIRTQHSLDQIEKQLDPSQDPERSSIEALMSLSKLSQSSCEYFQTDKIKLTGTETLPKSLQFKENLSTTEKSIFQELKPEYFETDKIKLTGTETLPKSLQFKENLPTTEKSIFQELKPEVFRVAINKDIELENSPTMIRSILYSKSPSPCLKYHHHQQLSMESWKEGNPSIPELTVRKTVQFSIDKNNCKETSIKIDELKFDATDPFSLEVMIGQENNVWDDSSLSVQKSDSYIRKVWMTDEAHNQSNPQNSETDAEESIDDLYPSDEEDYYACNSKRQAKSSNGEIEMVSPPKEMDDYETMKLRYFPEFLYNILFKDNAKNSQVNSKCIPTYSQPHSSNDNLVFFEESGYGKYNFVKQLPSIYEQTKEGSILDESDEGDSSLEDDEDEEASSLEDHDEEGSNLDDEDASSLEENEDASSQEEDEDASSLEEDEDASSLEDDEDASSLEEDEDASSLEEDEDASSLEEDEDASSLEEEDEEASILEEKEQEASIIGEEDKAALSFDEGNEDDIPSLVEEGWSQEEYDYDYCEPSQKETSSTRSIENDDGVHSIDLSEAVDRVLEAAIESGLFDTHAEINDKWLAKIVLSEFARAQNVVIDDLMVDV